MPLIPTFIFPALVGFGLFFALITYSLGIFVYAQKPGSAIHRLFLPFFASCVGGFGGEMDVFSDIFFCWKNTAVMPFIC